MSIAEDTLKSTADVELEGRRQHTSWPRQATLVDVMLAAGIDVPHSCREGRCGSCVCTVVSGEVDMAHSDILGPEDRQQPALVLGRAGPDPSPTSCTSSFDGSLSSADRDCCGADDAGCGRP